MRVRMSILTVKTGLSCQISFDAPKVSDFSLPLSHPLITLIWWVAGISSEMFPDTVKFPWHTMSCWQTWLLPGNGSAGLSEKPLQAAALPELCVLPVCTQAGQTQQSWHLWAPQLQPPLWQLTQNLCLPFLLQLKFIHCLFKTGPRTAGVPFSLVKNRNGHHTDFSCFKPTLSWWQLGAGWVAGLWQTLLVKLQQQHYLF